MREKGSESECRVEEDEVRESAGTPYALSPHTARSDSEPLPAPLHGCALWALKLTRDCTRLLTLFISSSPGRHNPTQPNPTRLLVLLLQSDVCHVYACHLTVHAPSVTPPPPTSRPTPSVLLIAVPPANLPSCATSLTPRQSSHARQPRCSWTRRTAWCLAVME